MTKWSLADHPRLRDELEALQLVERPWTMTEFEAHLREWRRRPPGTVRERLRHLKRLATHPLVPVKIHGTRVEVVESFYAFVRHRELVEGKKPTAIVNDYKAIRALGDFLRIPANVWPTRPTVPRRAKRMLPRLEQVYDLLHGRYTTDPDHSYENNLVLSMLGVLFGLNMRAPSELWSMRVGDYDAATHTLVVREPKKGDRTRRIYIEPTWLCCGKTRRSVNTFVETWRPKVDVGGTDAFWLQPDGQPFPSKYALARWLRRRVSKQFPWFSMYLGRRWGANARLIEWDFDYTRVADWLGHERVDRLRHDYDQDARLHRRLYGDRWLLRAFQHPRRPVQSAAPIAVRTKLGAEVGGSCAVPPVTISGPGRILPRQQVGTRTKLRRGRRGSCARSPSLPFSSFPLLAGSTRGRCQ